MAAISMLNPKAEVARASQALAVNISGAKVLLKINPWSSLALKIVFEIKNSYNLGCQVTGLFPCLSRNTFMNHHVCESGSNEY